MFISKDKQHIVVPYDAGLASIVPHARDFLWNGVKMLLFPNRVEEARIARNLGFDVPTPILTRYDWCGTKPWNIQKTTAALLTENPRFYVLSSMGTGKTRSVLYAADWLMRTKQVRRMLVIAPLSTLTPVWERELYNLVLQTRVRILHGSRDKRKELLAEGTDICVINHHGVAVMLSALVNAGFDLVVVDELAVLRNRRTDLWKAINAVISAPSTRYAWGLTGSPTPNLPTDAWAQVKLLTPARTTRTFAAFRDLTMRRISQFRWINRPEANTLVHQVMQPAVRYTRDDVMELPPCTTVERAVNLDPQAAHAYQLLYTKSRMLTQDTAESVTAMNEGVLQSKLLQVSCGYIYTDAKTVYALPMGQRMKALEEVLSETDRKVLVMVPFLHALSGISTYLRKQGHDIAVVHGGTARGIRDKIFTAFQLGASPRIIVAHPQTLSHGLTLTQANVMVWYSPTQSNETYEQACARINRPGQTVKTMIVHMVATSVERATYTRLRNKMRMQGCLLELFHEQEKPV